VQECDSVLEFLSDPWVMVQVKHFPSVLYQWLMAAYAEVLRFEQQLVDFHHLPFLDTPLICNLAHNLHYNFSSVKGGILSCFSVLQQLILEHKSASRMSASESIVDKMQIELDVILYLLKKFRSEKGQNIVKAFKRMCWDNSNKGPLSRPLDPSPACYLSLAQLHLRKYWADGYRGRNFFFPEIAKECSKNRCAMCELVKKEEIQNRREFEDYFKVAPNYEDLDFTMKKMVQFYDDNLEERFPPEAKTDRFLAHLVNKEILYLQWNFENTRGMI
jgi:hypothetical protein